MRRLPAAAVSIAIALPASLFLASCFMIANDSEAPESWLEWHGWRKLVFGFNAHRQWHYTGPLGQPVRHVKWFIRSVGGPPPETATNLWHSLVAWATNTDPPWVEEWREALEAEAEAKDEEGTPSDHDEQQHEPVSAPLHQVNGGGGRASSAPRVLRLSHLAEQDHERASTSSSIRSARALARYKRIVAFAGFIGVYVSWAIFAW